jgi:hypothetical protein
MRSLISHLRYTLRLLAKSPGFTITAVLILGFGIGLNTAIFSLVNAVILKPLPFPDPERLVVLFMPIQRDQYNGFDYPDYEDIRAAQHSFQELAIFTGGEMILTGRGAAEQIGGDFVRLKCLRSLATVFSLDVLSQVLKTKREDLISSC